MSASGSKHRHATNLVLFKTPSEQNEAVLTEVANVRRRPGSQGSVGILGFTAVSANRAPVRMFRSLAVAAIDAPDDVLDKLARHEAVADIVPNRIRTIPRRPNVAVGGDVQTAASASIREYVRGMRDATNAVLRQLGDSSVPQPSRDFGASADGRAGTLGTTAWALDMIGVSAHSKWDGEGVSVAVLDTGIDLTHPDFAERVTQGSIFKSFVSGVSTVQDGNGHGTHCAGIVAGPARPANGIRFGVAPAANLIIGKVLDDAGSGYDEDIVAGIQWAYDNGARVISLSLGSGRQPDGMFSRLYESLARPLLEAGNRSALICAATGNDSERPLFTRPVGNPAACPSILGVGAVDQQQQLAYFSDCQMDEIGKVDVVAPGVHVRSSWTGGGYVLESGTSMACPHVAGVAALHLQKDPSLTAKQVWELLQNGAKALGSANDFGRGIVQGP